MAQIKKINTRYKIVERTKKAAAGQPHQTHSFDFASETDIGPVCCASCAAARLGNALISYPLYATHPGPEGAYRTRRGLMQDPIIQNDSAALYTYY